MQGVHVDMSHKILVVDDDFDLSDIMQRSLQASGYVVRIANNGIDGLAVYHDFQPELILLDVAMPGMNGFEVAAEVRRLEKGHDQHTPIVILTAYAQSYFAAVGLESNIDSYLTKPIMPRDLVVQISHFFPENGEKA